MKIDDIRNNYINNETIALPFKPQVSKRRDSPFLERKIHNIFDTTAPNSKDIAHISDKLFEDVKKKKMFKSRLSSMTDENLYPFTPQITKNTKIMMKNKALNNVIERLTIASGNKTCKRLFYN